MREVFSKTAGPVSPSPFLQVVICCPLVGHQVAIFGCAFQGPRSKVCVCVCVCVYGAEFDQYLSLLSLFSLSLYLSLFSLPLYLSPYLCISLSLSLSLSLTMLPFRSESVCSCYQGMVFSDMAECVYVALF